MFGSFLHSLPANAQQWNHRETNQVIPTTPAVLPAHLDNLQENDSVIPITPTAWPTHPITPITDTYLLGVGDKLRVDVFNIPDYGGEFQILSGGILSLPVVGSVIVEGLSVDQASDRIETALIPFVRRPRVTVGVLSSRPLQVAIAGEVRRPGAYRLENDRQGNGQLVSQLSTLTQVIELAGGITQLADVRRVEVHRRLPLLLHDYDSSHQVIAINLWELLQEGDLDEDVRLQDGDRIIIPTATDLSAEEQTELASSNISADITVNVVGEVGAPGTVEVRPDTPLNQAILTAGGFTNRAKTREVDLIRLNADGTVSKREIEIDFSQAVNEQTNPSLRPNDTIVVRRSGLARTGDTVRSVLSPLNGLPSLLRLFGL